ncbi:flagellin N-terminal helical domain-containing protein [Halanaerobium polyolivorans]|uniref:flagellin N-terminal helical domain-containing protein n=1 Tax=Halanaerobium polyolivorans TaxID=2886943 RepID=UPI00272DDF89|nr:flagellin [Halanaerobium polyolivorans]
MRIQTNVESLNAYRNLNNTNRSMSRSMERLSSGFRINRASDDAAGLAISEKMRGQVRGLDQAVRNAQDATSMIQTAEGALNESHEILQQMRELAVQSANDTNTAEDRAEIQAEVDQLSAELSRIADTTEFNTQNLLDGSLESIFQIGANEGQSIDLEVDDMSADALGVSGDGTGDALVEIEIEDVDNEGDIANTGLVEGEQELDVVDVDNITLADDSLANYGLANDDGEIVAVSSDGQTFNLLDGAYDESNLSSASHASDEDEAIDFGETITGTVSLEANSDADLSEITATASIETEGLETGTYTNVEIDDANYADYFGEEGIEVGDNWNHESIENVLVNENGEVVAVDLADAVENVEAGEYYATDDIDFSVDYDANNAEGAVAEDAEAVMTTANLNDGDTLEVAAEGGIDVSSQEAADSAISTINEAIETVSSQRSELGAVQNRLDHTIANLEVASENLQAAESRIRDVDMAHEMSEFSKQQILEQAGTAMLAQANQAPQSVLQLLG